MISVLFSCRVPINLIRDALYMKIAICSCLVQINNTHRESSMNKNSRHHTFPSNPRRMIHQRTFCQTLLHDYRMSFPFSSGTIRNLKDTSNELDAVGDVDGFILCAMANSITFLQSDSDKCI